MARKMRVRPCMVRSNKATVMFTLVSWVFAGIILVQLINSFTKSSSQILPQTRRSTSSPAGDQTPMNYRKDATEDHRQHKRSRDVVVSPGISSPKPLSYETEQFTPLRYHFNKRYSTNIDTGRDSTTDKTRYLIYRCDGEVFRVCGGLMDRLRGIMAAYVIANLTGRVFKLEILSPPCDLQKNIAPNLVNWSLPVSFHRTLRSPPSDVTRIDFSNDRNFWNNVKRVDFTSLPAMKAKYVYYKSNLDHMDGFRDSKFFQTQVSWMKNMTRDQINAVIFKRLFKMSTHLETQVNSFLSGNLSPRDKLVCIHIRTGRNPTIPHDTEDRVRESDLPQIWEFLRGVSGSENDKIFLMTDSENVIADAKKQTFKDRLFTSEGKIVHVENSRKVSTEEKCAGMEKVLLEQFVLMHCDSLVISKSGLSRMAAYVRGSDEELYCVLKKGRVVPCKARDVKDLYGIMG